MALSVSDIKATVKTDVKAKLVDNFPDADAAAMEKMAEGIAECVDGIIEAIKTSADLTGVTVGVGTVVGGID